jgi:ferredoxin
MCFLCLARAKMFIKDTEGRLQQLISEVPREQMDVRIAQVDCPVGRNWNSDL